jgi:exopolysaccharide biosynthesis polyprenyl glycosylphosphotransferase
MTVHRSAPPGIRRLSVGSSSRVRLLFQPSGDISAIRAAGSPSWQKRYTDRLRISDTAVVCSAVVLAQYRQSGQFSHSLLLVVVWLCALSTFHSRSPRIIGTGFQEYRHVAAASFSAWGILAVAALLAKVEVPEGYLGILLPAGILTLLLNRFFWRKHLVRKRLAGSHFNAVFVVGNREDAVRIANELTCEPKEGFRVVGFGIPGHEPGPGERLSVNGCTVPVVWGSGSVPAAASSCGADTVVIVESGELGAREIQRLSWDLEPVGIHLVMAPRLMGVAASRLTTRQAAGVPLLHVEGPRYHAAERIPKRAFDYCFALLALAAALPILAVAAIAIKIDSRGPVFYRSERIGMNGKPFMMFKLRTMVQGADQQLITLLAANECDGLLFKIHNDPRVTSTGRFLRRFSIDELPQFLNVLRSEMSVVGPRPPLPREVEAYDGDVRRRLLIRPGITGPWQVSGRCDLPWDKATRLDLSYVDNWSLGIDLVIIAKTLRAVFQHQGAY